MRRLWLCCWKHRTTTWLLQLCVAIFTVTLMYLYHHDRMVQQQQHLIADLTKRDTMDRRAYDSIQCDLNRRQLSQLQRLLREKTQLLHYRGRVIGNLRKTIAELNKTKVFYSHTLDNLTEAVINGSSNGTFLDKGVGGEDSTSTNPKSSKPTTKSTVEVNDQRFNSATFANVRAGASRGSRPCCMALNRMTDILREYMETTQEVRLTVAGLRHNGGVAKGVGSPGPSNTDSHSPLLTTEEYLKRRWNFTKRPEKFAAYQLYTDNFFYESIPLNRLEPKQKLKTRVFRRNFDFKFAAESATKEVCRTLNLKKPSLLKIKESIFRYDELYGAHYRFTFLYNSKQLITSDVTKPYVTSYTTSNVAVISDSTTTLSSATDNKKQLVNVIIPVSQRSDRLISFLKNIHELRKIRGENIFVTIVIYDDKDSRNTIKTAVKRFSAEHNFTGYDILKKDLPFNRGRALHAGIIRWNGYPNVLLFLCDVDIKIKSDFFDRCRHYTDSGKSVYMPMVYSLFNPDVVFNGNRTLINDTDKVYNISLHTGSWRPYGYGMACFYKPDYVRAGGFNLRINGWGREDYNLYGRYF